MKDFFFSMCILMWHFRDCCKLLKNFPHLRVWEDYYVPSTSNHPQYFSRSTLLSGYVLPFYWWKKRDRKRWSGLPGINSLVCCFLKTLGTVFSTHPGGNLLEWHWAGLEAALRPQVLLSWGEWAKECLQLTAASSAAFQMALGITSWGQTFSSAFCPLTWTDFEMTGSRVDQLAPSNVPHASLGDLSPLGRLTESLQRHLCAFAEERHLLYSPVWWEGWIFMLLGEMQFDFF